MIKLTKEHLDMIVKNIGQSRSNINLVLLVVFVLMFTACTASTREKEYTKLVKFEIVNPLLDSLAHEIVCNHYIPHNKQWKEELMCLEINKYANNDSIEFAYTFNGPNRINSECALKHNLRILGYTTMDGLDIILFSNIDDLYDMTDTMAQYVKAADEYKEFEFLYKNILNYQTITEPILGENFCYYYRCYNGTASCRMGRWH